MEYCFVQFLLKYMSQETSLRMLVLCVFFLRIPIPCQHSSKIPCIEFIDNRYFITNLNTNLYCREWVDGHGGPYYFIIDPQGYGRYYDFTNVPDGASTKRVLCIQSAEGRMDGQWDLASRHTVSLFKSHLASACPATHCGSRRLGSKIRPPS